MNLSINRLLFLSLLSLSLCGTPALGNIFLNAAQDQIDKISPKKQIAHKSPLEFKQAVARYIKHTDNHCLQNSQRHLDENVSYKKELRYLFNNYGKFSTASLLSRLRSAHQAMVKHESNDDGDVYKRYEQISSALLLICTQVFFNDARNQVLDALQEVDSLIAYWRYQYHHQVSYFFSKSPVKWVVGKNQEKEIALNLSILERKQRELYTLLGLLTGHVHVFTESGIAYNDCYVWIEELFVVLSCINGVSHYNVDGTQFDRIAAELELKIKRVSELKDDYLLSVASARKPNHFLRNWIAYTTLVAAAGYTVHFNANNPTILPAAFGGTQESTKYLLVLLVDPLKKIYKRMETAFSSKVDSVKDNQVNQVKDNQAKEIQEKETQNIEAVINDLDDKIERAFEEIPQVADEVVSNIADELSISKDTARERLFGRLKEGVETIKNPHDGYVKNSTYVFPEEKQKQFNDLVDQISKKRVSPIFENGQIINKKEVEEYQKAKKDLQIIIADLSKQTSVITSEGWSACSKLNIFDILFDILDDFGEPLKKYTDIIDQKILKLVRMIGLMAVDLGKRGSLLAKESDRKLKEADFILQDLVKDVRIKLDEADATLQDNQLTFMFTSLIPLIATCFGITKTYQWATKKNYTPIRIALADVNALLIESAMQLDDHDYGKLVYLICKLRNRSKSLKSALSTEFLADVAKLESKRYTAQTKRDIVENMFNKYAFLGRIAA